MSIKIDKTKLAGIIVVFLGFLPTVYWAMNIIQSETTRYLDLLWGVPVLCIGAYLLALPEEEKE